MALRRPAASIDPRSAGRDASSAAVRIDVAVDGSVSSQRSDAPATLATGKPNAASRPPIAVGPGRPATAAPPRARSVSADVNNFPIQPSKIQAPPLRDQTLARERLLEWLHAKVTHRLVYLIAEAGYGKTTLLADFTRRSRLRVMWYRLDETDRDWVTVLNHLVAAGRVADPTFGSATWSLLGELDTGVAPMQDIVATYIRELQGLSRQPAALVLDDYHRVEDVPEIQYIVREIVSHAPERLAVVIASRRQPSLPTARLRALGELAELTREDLRFDPSETERLFRETYGRPLEPDVLDDLNDRTKGWVASLQLVQSALRDRSMGEARTFVQSLSGARGTLHDYLAEEVVGELPPDLQDFLMRTSILAELDVETAALASGVDNRTAERHVEEAARAGLLPRTDDRAPARYHPLVRTFLEDRLRREIGDAGVADLHRAVARYGETRDWKLAVLHYAAAGDADEIHRVLIASMQDIMGSGGFALAESYVRRYPGFEADPTFGIFLSRRDLYTGDFERARARASAAVDAFPADSGTNMSHLALANQMSIVAMTGAIDRAAELALALRERHPEYGLDLIARGTIGTAVVSTDGDLEAFERLLTEAMSHQEHRNQYHYAGITSLNLAVTCLGIGRSGDALDHANRAIALLSATSEGTELPTAHLARAEALIRLGDTVGGEVELQRARETRGPARSMALLEAGDIESRYGRDAEARQLISEVDEATLVPGEADFRRLILAELVGRQGDFDRADSLLTLSSDTRPRETASFRGRWLLASARLRLRAGKNGADRLAEARSLLRRQRARYWLLALDLVDAAYGDSARLNDVVLTVMRDQASIASVCAEDLLPRLGDLQHEARGLLLREARLRRDRWRPLVRRAIREFPASAAGAAAAILDEIGEASDVSPLREFARTARGESSALGRGLARRTAQKAHVCDLGRVSITVGERVDDGMAIRRKVLSLVCYLTTRPGFAATRDQVLEALWPDLEPNVAVNSLNQTIYFLRRVFEPSYREDESAQYVQHSGEVVRLDTDLVTSQSGICVDLCRDARPTLDPDVIDRLVRSYTDRFALDFEYEEWASPFRETLHAAYLDVVEQAIHREIGHGQFDRAGILARAAMRVDADAEPVEGALLQIYKTTGSYSAAAEQATHYRSTGADYEDAGRTDR
jgi:ATP/maltotriose-dependent transcriptional regulator MalT/DNA-binding SARP family transcriptional activator